MERSLIEDIPKSVLEESLREILTFSTGFVGVKLGADGEEATLLGSGTLIEIDGKLGILTARHVVNSPAFKDSEYVGLGLATHELGFKIEREFLGIVEVGKPDGKTLVPDLAVVIPPLARLGWIKAMKRPWNLAKWRDSVLSRPIEVCVGVWVVCGFPDECKEVDSTHPTFDAVVHFDGIYGLCGVEHEWAEGEYDYIEVSVSYEGTEDVPSTFRGMSGGGLWQIPLRKMGDGSIRAEKPILSGVAFYQSDVVQHKRTIRCHGRRSLYSAVFDAVKNTL